MDSSGEYIALRKRMEAIVDKMRERAEDVKSSGGTQFMVQVLEAWAEEIEKALDS